MVYELPVLIMFCKETGEIHLSLISHIMLELVLVVYSNSFLHFCWLPTINMIATDLQRGKCFLVSNQSIYHLHSICSFDKFINNIIRLNFENCCSHVQKLYE